MQFRDHMEEVLKGVRKEGWPPAMGTRIGSGDPTLVPRWARHVNSCLAVRQGQYALRILIYRRIHHLKHLKVCWGF